MACKASMMAIMDRGSQESRSHFLLGAALGQGVELAAGSEATLLQDSLQWNGAGLECSCSIWPSRPTAQPAKKGVRGTVCFCRSPAAHCSAAHGLPIASGQLAGRLRHAPS